MFNKIFYHPHLICSITKFVCFYRFVLIHTPVSSANEIIIESAQHFLLDFRWARLCLICEFGFNFDLVYLIKRKSNWIHVRQAKSLAKDILLERCRPLCFNMHETETNIEFHINSIEWNYARTVLLLSDTNSSCNVNKIENERLNIWKIILEMRFPVEVIASQFVQYFSGTINQCQFGNDVQ